MTLINITGLVIGFAACMYIFLYIHYEKSYDTFHKNFHHIFRVVNVRHYPSHTDLSAGCVPLLGPAIKENFPEVLQFTRCYLTSDIFVYQNNPVHLKNVICADSGFFNVFTFQVIKGNRTHLLTNPYSAVITSSASKKLFGDRNPIGETILRYGTVPYVIEAVIRDVPVNSNIQFDLLYSFSSDTYKNDGYCWTCNNKNTYLLLKDNTDIKVFEEKLQHIIPVIHKDEGFKREYKLQALSEIHLTSKLRFELGRNGDEKNIVYLSIVAILIIVIAWFNYINLSVSAAISRLKEVGIKKINGSNKRALVLQFLLEAFFINLIAMMMALVIVRVSCPILSSIPGCTDTLRNKGFWIILWLFTVTGTLIFGIYPSLVISSFKPLGDLKAKLIRVKGHYFQRILLVTLQFTISIILISSCLIVYQQVSFMKNKELGMSIEQTLVLPRAQVYLKEINYDGRKETFQNELLKNPNILDVAYTSSLPGEENGNVSGGIRIEGSSEQSGQQIYTVHVSKNYFPFLQIRFASGENFQSVYQPKQDIIPVTGDDQPVIINEKACVCLGFKSSEEAINNFIVGDNGRIGKIIGVIKDHHNQTVDKPIIPAIYKCVNNYSYFLIKTKTDNIPQTVDFIGKTFKDLYPDNPYEYFFLDDFFNSRYEGYLKFASLFSAFTILAIIVACIGLLGLVSFSTNLATKEIGIRKVNGSTTLEIIFLLTKSYVKWILLAFVISVPLTYFIMTKWLENFAYRTTMNWGIFALSGIIVLMIALITVSWQSWKAASRNPVESLRYE